MANTPTTYVKAEILRGNVDFDDDTFKIALMTTGYTFSAGAVDNWSDISASELVNGGGYTSGGITLSGVAIAEAATSTVRWNSVQWITSGGIPSIGPTPGAIVYLSTGATATSTVIGYIDFGSEVMAVYTAGGTFNITTPGFDLA